MFGRSGASLTASSARKASGCSSLWLQHSDRNTGTCTKDILYNNKDTRDNCSEEAVGHRYARNSAHREMILSNSGSTSPPTLVADSYCGDEPVVIEKCNTRVNLRLHLFKSICCLFFEVHDFSPILAGATHLAAYPTIRGTKVTLLAAVGPDF